MVGMERKLARIPGNLTWLEWIVLTMVGVFVFLLVIKLIIYVIRKRSTKPFRLVITNKLDRTENGKFGVR